MGCYAATPVVEFGHTKEHDDHFWAAVDFYSSDDVTRYIAVRRQIADAVYRAPLAKCTRDHADFIGCATTCLYCALIDTRATCMRLQIEHQIVTARVKMQLWDTDAHSAVIRADINITAIYLSDTIRYAGLLRSYILYADSGTQFNSRELVVIPALMQIYKLYFNR